MASRHPLAACVVLVLAALAASARAAPQVLVVGGEPRGWRKPAPNDETYNHWSARNRFHVGDFLRFKYDRNDSVLVVSRDDYKLCSAAKPTQHFTDGDTRFRLNHSGLFYFLSAAPGHCDAGQRMVVSVMAQHDAAPPAGAPAAAMSPGDDDDEGGYSGGSKPPPRGSGSVSISKPPLPVAGSDGGNGAKSSGAATVRGTLFVSGRHVVVGAVLGFVLMCLTP